MIGDHARECHTRYCDKDAAVLIRAGRMASSAVWQYRYCGPHAMQVLWEMVESTDPAHREIQVKKL